VRSSEIVFNEPFGQLLIEYITIGSVVAKSDELFLERAVESLIERIVGWRLGTRKVVWKMKILHGVSEVLGKLRSVVSLDVLHLSFEQVMHPSKEVSGMFGMFGLIHSGKCDFGIDINGSENVSAHTSSQHRDPIKRNQESFPSLPLELGDASSRLIMPPSGLLAMNSLRMIIQIVFFNNSLNFPRRNRFSILLLVENF